MQPKDDHSLIPNSDAPAPKAPDPNQVASQKEAAANVVRSQIASLYSHDPQSQAQPTPAGGNDTNPYARTHSAAAPQLDADQWQKYHSAWQSYYQKYYEGYYAHHYKNAQPAASLSPTYSHYFNNQPPEERQEELTRDEALYDMRQKLLGKVQDSARRVRGSRHFVPIVSAVAVMLIFMFLQFNRTIFSYVSAYVSPGNIDPQNIVIDPSAAITVGPEPRLIIPKINVDVPVIYGVGTDETSQLKAMEKGVAHFSIPGANSHPGQVGNTVLSGHSSNDLFDGGDYKFIFAQLEKLQKGDNIYVNYQSRRYTYTITKKEVVKPTQVDKLVYKTSKPMLTLITCTPLGTALNRLLVTAEQISPDPTKAETAPKDDGAATKTDIPGNSPTLLERIFGA